jgi:sulfite dehydrogenase (quinone) subunit SoeC
MHPAVSVIFFTVISGFGFGLITVVGTGLPVMADWSAPLIVCAVALAASSAGLLASTFHLGHPERAWRAMSQWRSSWLSREGILAIATLTVFAAYAIFWIFLKARVPALGLAASLLALATIFATAMIYTQLKSVPAWHSWLTPACYLAFALQSGLVTSGALGISSAAVSLPALAFVATASAWLLKWAWWRNAARGFARTASNTGTATGLGGLGQVRMLESPHSGENYLTREMVHRIGRKHATKLRRIAVLLGGIAPIAACLAAMSTGVASLFMALSLPFMLAGLLVERWLFFAEAKHAVSLYYQRGDRSDGHLQSRQSVLFENTEKQR